MQLVEINTITGTILLRSGLHIGAGKDTVEIGGLDQPVIKNPFNQEPYIPGSSLKGKMRSLLEIGVFMKDNPGLRASVADGKPCSCGKKGCRVCELFGAHNSPDKCDPDLGPTRMLVRDATLSARDRELFINGQLPMEIKYENTLNRVTGMANPRNLERVPAGAKFDFNIALRIFEGDDADDLLGWVLKGLKLVELDALGGGSSRGSGEVRFENICFNGEKKWDNLDHIDSKQIFQSAI